MEQSETITIKRSPDEVWGYVGDVRWWPKWIEDVSDVELISDELAPGSEVAYKWRGNDVTATITEYEPWIKIGISAAESSYDFHESIAVRPSNGDTEVTFTMGFTPTTAWLRVLAALLLPLKSLLLARPLKKELESLRSSVESGSPG